MIVPSFSTLFATSSGNIKIFNNFLKETCKISHPLYFNDDAKKFKIRSMTGKERIKIFEKYNQINLINGEKENSFPYHGGV